MRCTERAKRGVAAALVAAAALLCRLRRAAARDAELRQHRDRSGRLRQSDFTGRIFAVDPRVKGTVTLVVDRPVGVGEAIGALASALRVQNIALSMRAWA